MPSPSGEDEVMAFIVPVVGVTIDFAALVAHLVPRMPKFALPRYFEVLESFPTTQATFRTQKTRLRERGPGEDTFDRLQSEASG